MRINFFAKKILFLICTFENLPFLSLLFVNLLELCKSDNEEFGISSDFFKNPFYSIQVAIQVVTFENAENCRSET